MNVRTATVLICTYNRAPFLRETLQALVEAPRRDDYEAEILVVDNNSDDGTRQVVEEAARAASLPVRYAFDARQGKSFALNVGLRLAHGDIIAHTDDDVVPGEGWLDRMVDNFRARDITFAFGKVLPRWGAVPPPELLLPAAHRIWGPLALLDYGDQPVAYPDDGIGRRLPIGANLGFHRRALAEVGGWRTDLGKVDNSLISGEDHEVFHRLRSHGQYRGWYDPHLVVSHYVPASRLTRQYFRRWFYWHGKTMARMDSVLYDLDFSRVPHVFGAPRFIYRQALAQAWTWARKMGRKDGLALLIEDALPSANQGLMVDAVHDGEQLRAQAMQERIQDIGRKGIVLGVEK
ncbi:MAG TPA: glycosyltransferase, partial [Vicinamibacterales bacterium]|nr:glycosyltransferase [Vicinamibacterales bacterium]